MKKILLSLAICSGLFAKAQVNVDGVDINKKDINYIEVVGTMAIFTKKVTISIDYGQLKKVFDVPSVVKDDTGKNQIFGSMVDALNFLDKNGWQYVNSYIVSAQAGDGVYHYLLRKKTNETHQ